MRKRFTLSASLFVLCATLQLAAQSPPTASSGRVPGVVFRDCAECPEMVVVPAGAFTMGSSASEKSWAASHGGNQESVADESPQHVVSLPSFALGKYDVTRGEYAAFVRETGYPAGDGCGPDSFKWNKQAGVSWQNPGFSQTDRDPVVCINWQDARAYVAWLNSKVRRLVSTSGDGPYRLPSESEWEYAARAGTTTRFWWGEDDNGASGHAWYKDNSGGQTRPVGSKPANLFGLYDMVGDVWQWTQDCYADSYANAPTDGGVQPKGEPPASASIGAVPGCTLRGSSAQRPARGTPPTTGTSLWGFAWPGRSHEVGSGVLNLYLFLTSGVSSRRGAGGPGLRRSKYGLIKVFSSGLQIWNLRNVSGGGCKRWCSGVELMKGLHWESRTRKAPGSRKPRDLGHPATPFLL